MDLEETEAKNDCADGGQQQFNRPTANYVENRMEIELGGRQSETARG
jgi:hypothetical protein